MLVSPSPNSRPWAACTPRARKRCSSTPAERTRSGRSPAVRLTSPVVYAPTAANDWLISRNSMYSGGETQNSVKPSPGNWVVRYISCSGAGYPSGRRITLLTMEKIAVLAPMPSASVSTATAVNPGARRSSRHEYRTSWSSVCRSGVPESHTDGRYTCVGRLRGPPRPR